MTESKIKQEQSHTNVQATHKPAVTQLVDHLFRRESGRMVASLTRFFGSPYLALVEDAVQEALIKATQQWPFRGIPENPTAWLWQVAKNKAIDLLRRENSLAAKLAVIIQELEDYTDLPDPQLTQELQDNQLRMIFTCCHPINPPEAQVALTLRILCGFSIPEIARAFLTQETTIAKRLVRAKQKIRGAEIPYEVPTGDELSSRLEVVYAVLYLLFNEGYTASQGDDLIRWDLCGEAIRLTGLLVGHPAGNTSRTHALLALMLLHGARLRARQDGQGNLLPLSEQDRSLWDKEMILQGLYHLSESAKSQEISEYHLEAGIAACHCVVDHYEDTDWAKVLQLYDLLSGINASPVVALNRAVAVAKVYGPEAGIEAINTIKNTKAINTYYFLYATRAELYMQLGDYEKACDDYQQALALTDVTPEQSFITQKLETCKAKLSAE
jgi:RNA polymerase sigma-70 factor (ECF subfamily)